MNKPFAGLLLAVAGIAPAHATQTFRCSGTGISDDVSSGNASVYVTYKDGEGYERALSLGASDLNATLTVEGNAIQSASIMATPTGWSHIPYGSPSNSPQSYVLYSTSQEATLFADSFFTEDIRKALKSRFGIKNSLRGRFSRGLQGSVLLLSENVRVGVVLVNEKIHHQVSFDQNTHELVYERRLYSGPLVFMSTLSRETYRFQCATDAL
jgi:hypothetical protein